MRFRAHRRLCCTKLLLLFASFSFRRRLPLALALVLSLWALSSVPLALSLCSRRIRLRLPCFLQSERQKQREIAKSNKGSPAKWRGKEADVVRRRMGIRYEEPTMFENMEGVCIRGWTEQKRLRRAIRCPTPSRIWCSKLFTMITKIIFRRF